MQLKVTSCTAAIVRPWRTNRGTKRIVMDTIRATVGITFPSNPKTLS